MSIGSAERLDLRRTKPRRLPLWRKALAAVLAGVGIGGFIILSQGSVVLNGTQSLNHTGYLMLRWPQAQVRGAYAAFPAPEALSEQFSGFSFVKRIVGLPGDRVTHVGDEVCVRRVCRKLVRKVVERGFGPTEEGVIPPGFLFVVGDAEDSLDSRYGIVGLVAADKIEAVGVPAPLPRWQEIRTWMQDE